MSRGPFMHTPFADGLDLNVFSPSTLLSENISIAMIGIGNGVMPQPTPFAFFSMSNEMKSNPPRKGHIFNKIDWNKVRNLSLCQMSLLIFAFPICRSSSVSAEKTSCVVSSSRAIHLKFNGWNVKRMISLGALSIFCSFLPSVI